MKMNRRAVLISSAYVKGHKPLPGADVDVVSWRAFLKSNLGGSWNDSEIVELSKPLSADLKAKLDVPDNTYVLVAFSGHGDDGSVVLNDIYQSYSIADLRPRCKRGTLIVDSCRGPSAAGQIVFSERLDAIESRGYSSTKVISNARRGIPADVDRGYISESNSHRAYFDSVLSASSMGTLEMYSCAKGEGADEDPNSGGYYTSLLIQAAQNWVTRTSNRSFLSTKEANDYAASILASSGQNPEYRPSSLIFPFAVHC